MKRVDYITNDFYKGREKHTGYQCGKCSLVVTNIERMKNFIKRYKKEPSKKNGNFIKRWHEKHG